MFKKFTQEADVKSMAREKSSKARKILSAIREQYSDLEEVLEELFPDKKTPVTIATCKDRTELLVRNGQPIFYKPRDGPWVPTLKFLYQYPGCMKVVRVDKGAIRFVLRGAAVACGGLKQETSDLPDSPRLVFRQKHKTARGLLYISTYTFSTRFLSISKNEQTA